MKSLSTGKIWLFAAGQFGWSLLSGLISNWLVYFYQPDEASVAQGQTLFIPGTGYSRNLYGHWRHYRLRTAF